MNFSQINFIYYIDKVGLNTDTHKVDFSTFKVIANSNKILIPATSNLPEIAWVIRNVCLSKRSFLDRVKDLFSFLGYESSMDKADRLYYSILKINAEKQAGL